MDKLDIINALTSAGVFDLTHDILNILRADKAANHEKANGNLADLIESVDRMQNWVLFSLKALLDTVSQAYGFEKYLAYSDIDACADIEEPLEELYNILWGMVSVIQIKE